MLCQIYSKLQPNVPSGGLTWNVKKYPTCRQGLACGCHLAGTAGAWHGCSVIECSIPINILKVILLMRHGTGLWHSGNSRSLGCHVIGTATTASDGIWHQSPAVTSQDRRLMVRCCIECAASGAVKEVCTVRCCIECAASGAVKEVCTVRCCVECAASGAVKEVCTSCYLWCWMWHLAMSTSRYVMLTSLI